MRIICLNGWGGKLNDQLLPWLAQTDPDILCLQEVVHTPAPPAEWLTYRDGDHILPQRADFLGEVAAILPEHTATFSPASEGKLWDGDTSYPSQFGIATFVRRSIPVIGQTSGFVHGAFTVGSYGEHPRPRTAHAVRLYDRATQRPVVVAHMHGLRDLKGKHDTPARQRQAEKLMAMLETVSEAGDGIIICGDFNVLPESETLALLGMLGLRDLVTQGGFAGTRTSHYTKDNRFADYMLVNEAIDVKRFDVIRTPEVSDHCPLLLEIG